MTIEEAMLELLPADHSDTDLSVCTYTTCYSVDGSIDTLVYE